MTVIALPQPFEPVPDDVLDRCDAVVHHLSMIDAGLLTEETALKLVADVAQRFGQDFDAKTELEAARKESADRKAKAAASDVFRNEPADLAAARAERDAAGLGTKGAVAAGEDGNQVAA